MVSANKKALNLYSFHFIAYESSLVNLIIILNAATFQSLFHIILDNFPCTIYQNQAGSEFKEDTLLMSALGKVGLSTSLSREIKENGKIKEKVLESEFKSRWQ